MAESTRPNPIPARAADLPADIERAVGDLGNPDDVANAVKGVDAVFLMQVGGGTDQTKIMIDAVRNAGNTRIVLLSSVGARLMPISDNPVIGGALAARGPHARVRVSTLTKFGSGDDLVERRRVGWMSYVDSGS